MKLGQRFALVYWLFYFPALPLERIPFLARATSAWDAAWVVALDPVLHALGYTRSPMDEAVRYDTLLGYAHVFASLALALGAALVWEVVDRRRPGPAARLDRAHEAIQVLVRFGLASEMVRYGVSKVFDLQFPLPYPDVYVQPLSEWSRQTLLWVFMGASPLYTTLAGLIELAGGVLLFWRRTTTAGALIVIVAMVNVVLLNVAYDVPIKIHATHLLAMAIFVAWSDLERIARVVLKGGVDAAPIPPHFSSAPTQRLAWGLKGAFLVTLLACTARHTLDDWRDRGPTAPRAAIDGVWHVDSFARENQADGPGDPAARWVMVTITRGRLNAWRGQGDGLRYAIESDGDGRTARLRLRGASASEPFTLDGVGSDEMTLDGSIDGAETRVTLHRLDVERFKLRRPTRWRRDNPFVD